MKLKYSTKPDDLDKINSPDELKKIVRTHQKAARSLKRQRKALMYLLGLILATAAYFASVWLLTNIITKAFIHDIPVITVKRVQAAEVTPQWPDIGDCEQYRPVVEKYFGNLTDEALFVAKMEGGCIADRISDPNSDGSKDYCTFQINKEKLAAQSLEVCVRRAKEKYVNGRIGEDNWSDFYAVCPRRIDPVTKKDLTPIPKYPNVIKNCS